MVFGPEDPDIVDSALFSECSFIGNHSDYRAGGLFTSQDHVRLENCLFAENTSNASGTRKGTAIYALNSHDFVLDGVTIRDHESSPGAAVYIAEVTGPANIYTRAEIKNTVIYAGRGNGLNLTVDGINEFDISCTNLYGGAPGDWVGPTLLPFRNIQGNLSADPLFCSQWGDRRMVSLASPLLAENNNCGTDIGRIIGTRCGDVRLDDPDTPPEVANRGIELRGASPNPFNPRTKIQFELAEATRVRLDVYDARGRHVATVVDARRGPGLHEEVFDGRNLGSGVYHLRMEAGDQVRSESMVLVR
jgi:hypothetical protein